MAGMGPMNWLDPLLSADQKYLSLLASYAVWTGKALPFDPKEMYVFGDSGGFSVVSTGAPIDPRQSLRWQMRNCTAGVMLDIPPFDFGGNSRFVGSAADVWDLSMKRTLDNVRHALPEYLVEKRSGHPFRWWGVVQGESYEQVKEWFLRVSDLYPFDSDGEGWGLAPKPCNEHIRIARYLRLAREYSLKRVHVLQTSMISAVGVAIALASMAGVEFISNDSATVHINAGNRNVFTADKEGLNGRWVGVHRTGWEGIGDYLGMTCDCFSCQQMRHTRWSVPKEYVTRYYKDRLAYHNFLTLTSTFFNLYKYLESHGADALLREVTGDQYGTIMREFLGEGNAVKSSDKRTISIFDRLS